MHIGRKIKFPNLGSQSLTPLCDRATTGLTPFPPCSQWTGIREIGHGVHVTDGPERLFWPNKSYPPPALGV